MHRSFFFSFFLPIVLFRLWRWVPGNRGNSPVTHPCLCVHGSGYTFRPSESKCNPDHAEFVAGFGLNPWSPVSMHRTANCSRAPFPSPWKHNAFPTMLPTQRLSPHTPAHNEVQSVARSQEKQQKRPKAKQSSKKILFFPQKKKKVC